jgi:hypothetical protein
MRGVKTALCINALLALSLALPPVFFPELAAAQSSGDSVIYLNQGWSQWVRESYYHISQGSTVMPYDIFLRLEVADSAELFRSDANSERYGLTPDPVNPQTQTGMWGE